MTTSRPAPLLMAAFVAVATLIFAAAATPILQTAALLIV
mgnify:CR=1 FL=1